MNKIAKNYILILIYEFVAIVVPLLTAPYLTRVLHPENYGIYSYVQSFSGIIITLSLLGINSYGNRQIAYVRDIPKLLSQAFWEIMLLRLIIGVIGSICYFIIISFNAYNKYFVFYYMFFLSNIIDCSWIFVGTENMLPCVIKNIIAKIITLCGVFLLINSDNHVGRYIILVSLSSLITNISVYLQLYNIISKPIIKWGNLYKHLKGSIILFLPQIASILYLQMGKVIMGSITGKIDQVSFYDQAEKLVSVALSFVTVISTVMMPRIANEFKKNNSEAIAFYLNKSSRYSMAISAPMMICLLCCSIYLIPWYLGHDYMPTAYTIMIISPIVIFNSLLGISGRQYFVATNKIIPLTISNIIAAIVNLFMNIILIPRYGYKGAAMSTVVSCALNVIMQFYWMNKTISIYNTMRGTSRYFLYAVIMGSITASSTFVLNRKANFVTTVFQVLISGIIYLSILLIVKDEIYFSIKNIMDDCIRKIKSSIN